MSSSAVEFVPKPWPASVYSVSARAVTSLVSASAYATVPIIMPLYTNPDEEHGASPSGSMKFTGSPPAYAYIFQLLGFVGSAALASAGSGVKNLPVTFE